MRIVVDLNRCESYAQCVYMAPDVFWMHGAESLQYQCEPDDALRAQVERAAAVCPVQAIMLERTTEQLTVQQPAADAPQAPAGGTS